MIKVVVLSGHKLAPKACYPLRSSKEVHVQINVVRHGGDTISDSTCTTKQKSASPVWDEDFYLEAEPGSEQLQFVVYKDAGSNTEKVVGKANLDLRNILTEVPGEIVQPEKLRLKWKGRKRGHLFIYVAWTSTVQSDQISIDEIFVDSENFDAIAKCLNGASYDTLKIQGVPDQLANLMSRTTSQGQPTQYESQQTLVRSESSTGLEDTDIELWRENTIYKGYYHPDHTVIIWFWSAVLSLRSSVRAQLIRYLTGGGQDPGKGFSQLYGWQGQEYFVIQQAGNPQNAPRFSPLHNRLDLPPYESYDDLMRKLMEVILSSES